MLEAFAIGLFVVTLLITIFGNIALRRLWLAAAGVAVIANSFLHIPPPTLIVLLALYLGAWALGYLVETWQAGQLLLQLNKPRARRYTYFYRIYILIVAGLTLFALQRMTASWVEAISAAVVLTIYLIMFVIIGPNIRTSGILSAGDFIKWASIKSYEWHGNTLIVNVRVPLTAFWRVRVPVAPTSKEAVDHLLAEKIPGKKVSPGLAD
jgi:hypothetical protein